jgi:hypothetical protein
MKHGKGVTGQVLCTPSLEAEPRGCSFRPDRTPSEIRTEEGQPACGLGRTWGRRGHTPVVRVTGGSNRRVSLAALIAVKPGCRPRLIYRVHTRRRGGGTGKGFVQYLAASHLRRRVRLLLWFALF